MLKIRKNIHDSKLINFCYLLCIILTSLIAQLVKNLTALQETLVQFLGGEDMLEKG